MNEPKDASIVDLNHNGIPDYQEAWFYSFLWAVARTLIRAFAPSHTIVRRGVEALDDAIKDTRP